MKVQLAALSLALLLAPSARAQQAFVVPSANEAVEGSSNNTIPFSIIDGDVRYQQVYLESDIPPGPFTINGIAFRPDELQSSFSYEIPNVDIYLGNTDAGTSLNPEFAANIGLVHTLVASGPLLLASAASGPVGGPLAFDIQILFDQPFAYVGGNLLLDVFVSPYTSTGNPLFDAVTDAQDPVGRVYSAGLAGGSENATSGTADTPGLVTQFLLAPEPAGATVVAIAALAALARSRRR